MKNLDIHWNIEINIIYLKAYYNLSDLDAITP